MVKIDATDFKKMLDDIQDDVLEAWQGSGAFFKNTTPVRSGNARSRTHTVNRLIGANYGYAARLDDGWSKQAPRGMSNPTIDYFEKQIDNIVRKYG